MPLVSDRFQAKVNVGMPGECWEFKKRKKPGQYPSHTENGRTTKASRWVLAWKLGRPIRPKMEAAHTCDNTGCCNPEHLWEATHRENMLDSRKKERLQPPPQSPAAQAKQRANTPRGERSPMRRPEVRAKFMGENNRNGKLTADAVREIRRLRAEGKLLKQIAPLFAVSLATVSQIARNHLWCEQGGENRKARPTRAGPAPKPLDRPKRGPRGMENGAAKLTAEQVAEIRRTYAAGGVTQAELGRRFGVTQTSISMITTGQTRQHG